MSLAFLLTADCIRCCTKLRMNRKLSRKLVMALTTQKLLTAAHFMQMASSDAEHHVLKVWAMLT